MQEVGHLVWLLLTHAADAAYSLGDIPHATQILLQAAEHARDFGRKDLRLADSLNKLGVLHFYQGEVSSSRVFLESALGVQLAASPEEPRTASVLANLAAVRRTEKIYDEAESLYEHACRIFEESMGLQDPELALTLQNLAEVYLLNDKHLRAFFCLRRALRICDAHKKNGWTTAAVLCHLGDYYSTVERLAEAAECYWRAFEIRKVLAGKHPSVANALRRLVDLYHRQGKLVEAEMLQRWSLIVLELNLGTSDPDYLKGLERLARVFRAQGRMQEAEQTLEDALPRLERALGARSPQFIQILQDCADMLTLLRLPEKAEKYAERARALREGN